MDGKKKVKITQRIIVKAPGLLPMEYKLSEIVEDLKVTDEFKDVADMTEAEKWDAAVNLIKTYLNAGAPYWQDEQGEIWMNGAEFARWVEATRLQARNPDRPKMADNQALCLRCKKQVDLIDPIIVPARGKRIIIKGKCPDCGCTINRGGRGNG